MRIGAGNISIPGGGKAPASIPASLNPLVWVKAGADCEEAAGDPCENGDGVTRWLDNGSSGSLFTEATNPPAFETAVAALNGKDAVVFDDATALMKLAHGAAAGTFKCLHDNAPDGGTLAITFEHTGLGILFATFNTSASAIGAVLDTLSTDELRVRIGNGSGTLHANGSTSTSPVPTGSAYCLVYRYSPSLGVSVRCDGVETLTIAPGALLGSPSPSNESDPLTIGNRNSGSVIIGAKMHEIVVINSAITGSDLTGLEAYMMGEVGL